VCPGCGRCCVSLGGVGNCLVCLGLAGVGMPSPFEMGVLGCMVIGVKMGKSVWVGVSLWGVFGLRLAVLRFSSRCFTVFDCCL
jgi:hypothetical protein